MMPRSAHLTFRLSEKPLPTKPGAHPTCHHSTYRNRADSSHPKLPPFDQDAGGISMLAIQPLNIKISRDDCPGPTTIGRLISSIKPTRSLLKGLASSTARSKIRNARSLANCQSFKERSMRSKCGSYPRVKWLRKPPTFTVAGPASKRETSGASSTASLKRLF